MAVSAQQLHSCWGCDGSDLGVLESPRRSQGGNHQELEQVSVVPFFHKELVEAHEMVIEQHRMVLDLHQQREEASFVYCCTAVEAVPAEQGKFHIPPNLVVEP